MRLYTVNGKYPGSDFGFSLAPSDFSASSSSHSHEQSDITGLSERMSSCSDLDHTHVMVRSLSAGGKSFSGDVSLDPSVASISGSDVVLDYSSSRSGVAGFIRNCNGSSSAMRVMTGHLDDFVRDGMLVFDDNSDFGRRSFRVFRSLGNMTADNDISEVAANGSYDVNLSADQGCGIDSVICLSNGRRLLFPDGHVHVGGVTSDIMVFGFASVHYSVGIGLSHSSCLNSDLSVGRGKRYENTFFPEKGYSISSISCVMGGIDIIPVGNSVKIDFVTGDIRIDVSVVSSN